MKRILLLVVVFLFVQQPVTVAQNTKATTGTAIIKTADGLWSFTDYGPHVLKVVFKPLQYTTGEQVSDAVIAKPLNTPYTKKQLDADGDVWQITWKSHTIRIDHSTIYFEKDTIAILQGYHQADEYRGFRFALKAGEQIFGGGERALPLNRRGYRFNLYNNPWYGYSEGADNLNYSVPFITSSKGYALFFDNPSKGYLDIGKTDADQLEYGACSGQLNFYLITGGDYPAILQQYCKLTGTQPLPPRWALGNFMSRFGYTSEAQAKEIYAKMNSENVPFDAVIFDLFWFGDSIKNTLGNLDWVNKSKWPDPAGMIAGFKKDGVQSILVTEPFILEGTKSYTSFLPYLAVDSAGKPFTLTDFYFGRGGLVDVFRKDAKDHFWSYYKKQMNIGVAGWWGDLGEPEKHPAGIYHNLGDLGYKRLFRADEVHNLYGHNWTKMLYQKFAAEYPEKRLFSLNRSGFAGTQRYCIFPWSGDVSRSWSGFRAQLPIMLGMSMSGIPYIHADAGGFAGGEGDNELYVRWLQFAQYTPIFRPHGTALFDVDPNTFNYPSEIALFDEPFKSIARQVTVDRYRMLPYNYTLSYQQTRDAAPLVSPLYYYFGKDTTSISIADAFMFGKHILVAPVLDKLATIRTVYLPKGDWYKWNSNTLFTGGAYYTEQLTLSQVPVFVQAGSIIPLLPADQPISNTASYTTKNLEWHYYAGSTAASFTLFDDDGESRSSIAAKQYELITMNVLPGKDGYQVEVTSNGGTFKGKPAARKFSLVMHGVYPSFVLNTTQPGSVKQNTLSSGEPVIEFEFTGKPVRFTLSRFH